MRSRMSPVDRAFFLLETEQRPMNVGVLMVVTARPDRYDRASDWLVDRMLRCPVGPPFNQRLTPGPWPELVEAQVDPAEQLYRHRLPAGSDVQALFARVCELHPRRLDRARPLWEMHVFDGLEGGRVGLYFKTHHGLIDGLGFLGVIRHTVSTGSGGRTPQAIWRGLPTSSGTPAAPAVLRPGLAADWWHLACDASRTAGDLARLAWHIGRRDLGRGPGFAMPFAATPNVLKAPPSSKRALGHCVLPLSRVRAIARAADCTVNDVVLTTLDVALAHYLQTHGVRVDKPLVADMPVALQGNGGAGNRISILQVPMGRPGGTPKQRLADVVRETRTVKDEVRALSPDALYLYSIAEHAVASAVEALNLGELPMLANAVISNPTGLEAPVRFNGLPVELALPVSVVAHHQVLNVTVTNYGDDLNVTFIALRDALPDLQVLADTTARALMQLQRSVTPRRRRPASQPRIPRLAKRPAGASRPVLH